MLVSEAQQLLEAATRLLLVTQHTSEGPAAGLKLRIAAVAQIGAALRSSQEALDKALNTPTLTSGEGAAGYPVYLPHLSPIGDLILPLMVSVSKDALQMLKGRLCT